MLWKFFLAPLLFLAPAAVQHAHRGGVWGGDRRVPRHGWGAPWLWHDPVDADVQTEVTQTVTDASGELLLETRTELVNGVVVRRNTTAPAQEDGGGADAPVPLPVPVPSLELDPVEPTPPEGCAEVADVLASAPELRFISEVVKATGLPNLGPGPLVTLLAPNDKAFTDFARAAGFGTLQELLEAENLLDTIVPYHTLDGVVLGRELVKGAALDTELGGAPLGVTKSVDGATVILSFGSNATVVEADIATCRGVVHVLNAVLVPQVVSIL